MKPLELTLVCTVLRLSEAEDETFTLAEQIEAHIARAPAMLVDVTGIRLTSMRIGELVNLYRAFEAFWGERRHRLVVVDRGGDNVEVLKRSRLDQLFPVVGSLDEAHAEVS